MQQLGSRLVLLHLTDHSADALELPAELLALRSVQQVRLMLFGTDEAEAEWYDMPGLERVPALRALAIYSQMPRSLWQCTQLTALSFDSLQAPRPSPVEVKQLSRLQFLELAACYEWDGTLNGFPDFVFQLTGLTHLAVKPHWPKQTLLLPLQLSQLR